MKALIVLIVARGDTFRCFPTEPLKNMKYRMKIMSSMVDTFFPNFCVHGVFKLLNDSVKTLCITQFLICSWENVWKVYSFSLLLV